MKFACYFFDSLEKFFVDFFYSEFLDESVVVDFALDFVGVDSRFHGRESAEMFINLFIIFI